MLVLTRPCGPKNRFQLCLPSVPYCECKKVTRLPYMCGACVCLRMCDLSSSGAAKRAHASSGKMCGE